MNQVELELMARPKAESLKEEAKVTSPESATIALADSGVGRVNGVSQNYYVILNGSVVAAFPSRRALIAASSTLMGKSLSSEVIVECIESGAPLLMPKGIFSLQVNGIKISSIES